MLETGRRLQKNMRMRPEPANRSAEALVALQRRVFSGTLLSFTALCGLQLAVEVYSGPSIATGLAIAALFSVAAWQAILRLPETAARVIGYVCALLLM